MPLSGIFIKSFNIKHLLASQKVHTETYTDRKVGKPAYRGGLERAREGSVPLHRNVRIEYAAPVDRVVDLLSCPQFLKQRSEALGERDVHVLVEEQGSRLTVRIERRVPVDLPAFARRFVQPTHRVVEESQGVRSADGLVVHYRISIGGVPASVQGEARFEASESGGCLFNSDFEISSSVPVIGARLEQALADPIERSFFELARRNAQELAARGAATEAAVNPGRVCS